MVDRLRLLAFQFVRAAGMSMIATTVISSPQRLLVQVGLARYGARQAAAPVLLDAQRRLHRGARIGISAFLGRAGMSARPRHRSVLHGHASTRAHRSVPT